MRKEEDPQKIEAVFQRMGLGSDPEKLTEFLENYERSMATADYLRNKKGKKFKDVLANASEKDSKEES